VKACYYKCVIAAIVLLIAGNVAVWGQRAPKYSNEFLNIGVGARAAGMGNAQVGIVSDVTAGYWNPAGLTEVPQAGQLALMHSQYFANIANWDYGAFATGFDEGRRFGVSFVRLAIDNIPNTLNIMNGNRFDFSRVTSFSVADMALLLSYAQLIQRVEGLAVGFNAKIVNRTVGNFANAWGFGLDAGVQYRKNNLKAGLMVTDITSTFNAWSFNTETFEEAFRRDSQLVPQNSLEITLPAATVGMGYTLFAEKKLNILVTADVRMYFDGPRSVLFNAGPISFDPRVGLEANYMKIVYLRAGMMNFQKIPNSTGEEKMTFYPCGGLGLQIGRFTIDYALSNIGDFKQNLYSHLFSLRLTFGKDYK
jgi:hypothetical protein